MNTVNYSSLLSQFSAFQNSCHVFNFDCGFTHASIWLVSCPAGLALMRKHRLVTMLKFLGPRSAIQPKYWLAIRIEELHNRMNVLEVDEKTI